MKKKSGPAAKTSTYTFQSIEMLRKKRAELQLSQTDLARMAKVSKMYISDFERGVRPMPEHLILLYAKAFNLGRKFILAWEKDKKGYQLLKLKERKESLVEREAFMKETFFRTPSGEIRVRHKKAKLEAKGNKIDRRASGWKKRISS